MCFPETHTARVTSLQNSCVVTLAWRVAFPTNVTTGRVTDLCPVLSQLIACAQVFGRKKLEKWLKLAINDGIGSERTQTAALHMCKRDVVLSINFHTLLVQVSIFSDQKSKMSRLLLFWWRWVGLPIVIFSSRTWAFVSSWSSEISAYCMGLRRNGTHWSYERAYISCTSPRTWSHRNNTMYGSAWWNFEVHVLCICPAHWGVGELVNPGSPKFKPFSRGFPDSYKKSTFGEHVSFFLFLPARSSRHEDANILG